VGKGSLLFLRILGGFYYLVKGGGASGDGLVKV
jgi:hypothetical protein